jgi:hypothetical protein
MAERETRRQRDGRMGGHQRQRDEVGRTTTTGWQVGEDDEEGAKTRNIVLAPPGMFV